MVPKPKANHKPNGKLGVSWKVAQAQVSTAKLERMTKNQYCYTSLEWFLSC
jgi:hypothetical protein